MLRSDLCGYSDAYIVKETSWIYFEVFLIYLISASLEWVASFEDPKLNERPGRSLE